MAKKKTKEPVIPFQIKNNCNEKWFIQIGWKYYLKITPIPFLFSKPCLNIFK